MKAALMALTIGLFVSNASAADVSQVAYSTLMEKNPVASSFSGDWEAKPVRALVEQFVKITIGKKQVDVQTFAGNVCLPKARTALYDCALTIMSIEPGVGSSDTRSSLMIEYMVDRTGKTIIGDVKFMFAG